MLTRDNSNNTDAPKTKQSGMTLPSLETVSFFASVAVVLLTVFAAIAGAFALYFSSRLGAVKDAALERFKTESATTIATAGERAAEANNKAAEANERAKALELEVAKQRERAAKAEKDLLELQQRLAWRSFTTDQQQKLVAELSRFGGVNVVVTQLGEVEAGLFAKQLLSILTAARWSVARNFAGSMSPPPYGIICTHLAGDKAADAFIQFLRSTNMIVSEHIGGSFQILVGLNPPP